MHISNSQTLRTFRFKVKCQSIKIKTFVFPSTSSTHYNHKVKEKICMWVMWVMNREWLLCHSPQFDTFYQGRTKWRNLILALYDMPLMLCNKVGWENFHSLDKNSVLGQPKQTNRVVSLKFWGLVYSSSTLFFLAFKHKRLEI